VSLLLTDRAFHFGCVFGFVGAGRFVFTGFNFFGSPSAGLKCSLV
jgi:hypothetical protein